MTGERRGDRVKGQGAPPDVEEEVLERLPRWRRELLRIRDQVREEDKAPRRDERE